MVGWEREISPRTGAWVLILGGSAFTLVTLALAAAYVWLDIPVNGESGMPPSQELATIFAVGLLISVAGVLTGTRNLRRAKRRAT